MEKALMGLGVGGLLGLYLPDNIILIWLLIGLIVSGYLVGVYKENKKGY